MSLEILDLQDRFGYIVEIEGMRIFQEYAPALGGKVKMTKDQAGALAILVEEKLIQINVASVNSEQIHDLWEGNKSIKQIIDEEKALMEENK